MTESVLPLFPLRTVLFTGGQLPLRIFEARYLDMVSSCMREGACFGVVLIRQGAESRRHRGQAQPDIFDVGTEARIVDFNQLSDGLLGVVCQGERKFRVRSTFAGDDQLLMGKVRFLDGEPSGDMLPEYAPLVDILRELVKHPMIQKLKLDVDFDDPRSVSFRLAELLPIEPEIKQSLLQLHTAKERLTELTRIVNKLRG